MQASFSTLAAIVDGRELSDQTNGLVLTGRDGVDKLFEQPNIEG
jgi:hypothetical protein